MNGTVGDMTPKEARRQLGLHNRTQFWKVIYARRVPHIRYTSRCIRFSREAIESLRNSLMVLSPDDLNRLSNGQRKP
ncbi:MAG: hypothetical protein ACYCPQ_10335 [Elusimicrobiota bacterium]